MLAVAIATLINVNALSAHFAVSFWALTVEAPLCVDALLTGLAVVPKVPRFIHLTLVYIYAAVSLGLVAHGAVVIGLRAGGAGEAWGRGVWGWDNRGRAGQAQVTTIMVEAFHLSFTGVRDSHTFINVFAMLCAWVPLVAICAFRVGVTF